MKVSDDSVETATSLRIRAPIRPEHLGDPDADHHDQDDSHRREAHEVADERGEQVPDPSTVSRPLIRTVSVTIL